LFTLQLSNPVSVPTIVNITVGGTATEGTDYSTIGTTVVIDENTTSVTIPVYVLNDFIVEPGGETLAITLGSTDNAVSIAPTDNAEINIADDDFSEVSIVASEQAAEPGTNGQFSIALSNPLSVPTTVTFAVSGSATAGTDYSAIGTSVIIPANETTVTVPVNVIDDILVETGGETVAVTLTGTNSDATLSATDNATVTIADNDVFTVTG
jgi:hypothetical protein